jgi:hypothetical protein
MRPEDDPGWDEYSSTILIVDGEPPLEIDLALPVGDDVRKGLVARGLDRPFGILTPCNPRGRRLGARENEERFGRFMVELDASGRRYVRIDGATRDRTYIETGVGIIAPRGEVVALAREWEQSAIYWWDGDGFWVVGALTVAEPRRLGTVG